MTNNNLFNSYEFEKLLVKEGYNIDLSMQTICKICGDNAPLFDVIDFNKTCLSDPYPCGLSGVSMYWNRCNSCGLVFTNAFDSFSSSLYSIS